MSPFKIVRSSSVDSANRSVTTYKVDRPPTNKCWEIALLQAVSGEDDTINKNELVDKTNKESDGVEAFQEEIKRKDTIPLMHTPHKIAKNDMDKNDIKMFIHDFYEGKDSHILDIKPDTLGKGRIFLLKRSPLLHSESDAEDIKDEDVTSGRNRSPAFRKDVVNDGKPDILMEEHEVRDVEQDAGLLEDILDFVKSKLGVQDAIQGCSS